MEKGNTEGSRLSTDNAYIAGFLDGDGSIMLQIKKRSDTKRGFRFLATICFYQDSRHDAPLSYIQKCIGVGYISKRNDGITELRVNGFKQVRDFLRQVQPFIRFKSLQCEAVITACGILDKGVNTLSHEELVSLVGLVMLVQHENYSSHSKKTREELFQILGLTPYRLEHSENP